MLTAFCSNLLESASTWFDTNCYHNNCNRNRNRDHNPKALALPESQPNLPLQSDDTAPNMPVNGESEPDLERHPEPPRAQLRSAYQNAKHILTSLLAIEFTIEGLFKHRTQVLVAVEGIRRHLRSDHGGVLPDILLGEWCRKRKPYAAGTVSKLGSSVRLTKTELERVVEWWADWGRVEGEFWFLVEEDRSGFGMVGRVSEEMFEELETMMHGWAGERERRERELANSADDSDSVPQRMWISGDSAGAVERQQVESTGENGSVQQQRRAMTDIISNGSDGEGLEKEEEFLQHYSLTG